MVLRWMVCDTLLAYEVAVVEKYIHASSRRSFTGSEQGAAKRRVRVRMGECRR